jgi:hypothetical protein
MLLNFVLLIQFGISYQNDIVDYSPQIYTVPLNFYDAIRKMNQKLKYKKLSTDNSTREYSQFFNYDTWTHLKSHIDKIDEKTFSIFFPNITKPCSEKMKFLINEVRLKKEWAIRG